MPWACKRLRPTTMSRGSPRNGSESNPPSLELTLAVRTRHRLDRATQSGTGHWRGEVIEANENKSTSIQDARELPRTKALFVHIPTHATHRHTACQQPPPCLVSLACLRLRSSVRSRQVAIICFSISPFALARPRRSMLLAWACLLWIACA